MTYAEMFARAKALLESADAGAVQGHLAYQFNVTGEAAGVFYVEVKDGHTCSAETLEKIASGKTDPVAAVMMGKLKVEGSIEKALKLKDLLKK